MTTHAVIGTAVAASAITLFTLSASSNADVLQIQGDSYGISVAGLAPGDTIIVAGPNGYSATSSYGYLDAEYSALADGVYNYEILRTEPNVLSSAELDRMMRDRVADGRPPGTRPGASRTVVARKGTFLIRDGVVAMPSQDEE